MSVEVGQPIQATLSIRPNFSWASSSSYSCPAVVDPITLIYDVTTNDTDWIISGRKKGEFLAKVHLLMFDWLFGLLVLTDCGLVCCIA